MGGLVVRPDGPRPLRRQQRGGMPILVSDEASRWLQQCGATAGASLVAERIVSAVVAAPDGESCAREDIRQVSSSTGGLSGGLVGGMKQLEARGTKERA